MNFDEGTHNKMLTWTVERKTMKKMGFKGMVIFEMKTECKK